MRVNRRSIGKGLAALGVAAAIGSKASAAVAGAKSMMVSVSPASGSTLEADDPQTIQVRDSLTSLLLQNPTCGAGKIGDRLETEFQGAVDETRYAIQYIWRLINGHWVHEWSLRTDYVVDFGANRTVLVTVVESEPKPL
jgi:hypothetical protein